MQGSTPTKDRGSDTLNRSIRSGMWLTIDYATGRILGVLSFFVLARLLKPADFGIMSIVFLVPKFLQAVTEPGFSSAVIQREGAVDHYLNPIWTIRVLRSFLVTIAVFLLGPMIANFFHARDAALAIRLGGIFFLIQDMGNIGEIFFYKNIEFKKVFLRNLTRQIAYILVTIAIALFSPTMWALFFGNIALYASEALSTYVLHPFRPRFTRTIRKVRDLVPYSKWIFGKGLLGEGYGLIESAAVGRITDVSSIGLFSKAKSLGGMAAGFLTSVISTVSLPAYAKVKNEPKKIRDGFLKSMDLVSFFLIPATVFIFLFGTKLIFILLGPAWVPMTNPLRILIVYYGANAIVDIAYKLLAGIGYPDKEVKFDIVQIVITIVLILVLTPRAGIIGTSVALLMGLLPILGSTLVLLKRFTGVRFRDMVHTALAPLGASMIVLTPILIFSSSFIELPLLFSGFLLFGAGCLYCLLLTVVGKRYRYGPYPTIKIILRHVPYYESMHSPTEPI